jgi:hypothetical protein
MPINILFHDETKYCILEEWMFQNGILGINLYCGGLFDDCRPTAFLAEVTSYLLAATAYEIY